MVCRRPRQCYHFKPTGMHGTAGDNSPESTSQHRHLLPVAGAGSRPRRFGKSLFLDTLKQFFEGNEPLFAALVRFRRH